MSAARDAAIERRRRKFAAWLRDARLKAQLTQEQLSVKIDKSQSAVTNWERDGLETMLPEEMLDLAAALDVQPAQVAAALGYPVMPRERRPIPLSPIEALDAAAELSARLARAVEEWASEHFPATDEAQPPGRRNGSLG